MDVLFRGDLFFQPATPGFEPIDPAFHGVLIPPKPLDAKLAAPTIVAERLHRHCSKFLLILPIKDLAGHQIVPLCKHISFHDDRFSNNALDGKHSAIDFRHDPFDHHAVPSVHALLRHSSESPRLAVSTQDRRTYQRAEFGPAGTYRRQLTRSGKPVFMFVNCSAYFVFTFWRIASLVSRRAPSIPARRPAPSPSHHYQNRRKHPAAPPATN